LAGFFLGALMLVVSPGSIYRATSNVGIHNKQELLQLLLSMENLRITYLAIIVIPLLAIIKQIRLGEFLKREMWLVIAIAISVLFILATTHHSGHSRMGIELFSLMLLCRALPWEKISGIAISTATVAALIVGVFAVEACEKCYRANEDEFAQIRRHEYPIKTHLPVHDNYLSRFIVPYSYNVMGIDFKTYGTDEFICKYFHNDSIYFLPAQFVSATKDDPKRLDTFQTEDSWPFYAKRENKENGDSEMTYATIEYSPYPYSSLNWPLRIIAPKLPGYNSNQVPVKIQRVTLDGSSYILVEKNPDMTFRLKKITLMR
jgi:hypothetical protein